MDTHVWIWAFEGSPSLGSKCARMLKNPANERWVSPVSTLEIARLLEGGRITLACPLAQWLEASLSDLRIFTIPLDHTVAMEAYRFPSKVHPHPADRMIVAAARIHGCQLVAADERILNDAQVPTIDARR